MLSEYKICPYIKNCRKYNNGNCFKVKIYWECGDFNDFILESNKKLDENIKNVIDNLKMHALSEKNIKEDKINKNEKRSEKCPYEQNCYLIFEKP